MRRFFVKITIFRSRPVSSNGKVHARMMGETESFEELAQGWAKCLLCHPFPEEYGGLEAITAIRGNDEKNLARAMLPRCSLLSENCCPYLIAYGPRAKREVAT